MNNYIDQNYNVSIFEFVKIWNSKIKRINIIICCLKKFTKKKRNKENDCFYGQICVEFMKKKNTNCENNVEPLLLETYNLLDGYIGKELCLLWIL